MHTRFPWRLEVYKQGEERKWGSEVLKTEELAPFLAVKLHLYGEQ